MGGPSSGGEDSEGPSPRYTGRDAEVLPEVLRGEREVALLSPPAPTKRSRAADGEDPLSEEQHDVFERLRGLRRRLADEHGVPPSVVFNDATLREMVRRMPASPEEMLSIKGVGQAKMQRFGDAFLDELLSVSRG